MVLSLLFGKKYNKTKVAGIFLDVTITENHSYNSKITSYPVEGGENISDHIINDPETLQLMGLVTDTPLSLLSSFNRSNDAFNRLLQIHQKKEIVTIITGIKVYTDMVLISLNVPRNIATGQSLTFDMEFQKIIIERSTTFTQNQNRPFDRITENIEREQVAESQKYPGFENGPLLEFKDQSQSSLDFGIQNLLQAPPVISAGELSNVMYLQGILR